MEKLNVDAVFIVHVKQGYKDREKHINQHLPSRGIVDFEYMLNGDIDDLSDELIQTHFTGIIQKSKIGMSCAYKHFLIYQQMVQRQIKSALVLEDDIFLDKNFVHIFNQSVAELPKSCAGAFINFERAGHYVPILFKRRGQCLYRSKENKLNGAYYLDATAASEFYQYIQKNKCAFPADWMITKMSQAMDLPIYWCEPTIAEQGSKNGVFASELSGRKKGPYQKIKWLFDRVYKQNIRSNFSLKNISKFK